MYENTECYGDVLDHSANAKNYREGSVRFLFSSAGNLSTSRDKQHVSDKGYTDTSAQAANKIRSCFGGVHVSKQKLA
jgi:hypothetical protein